VVKDLVSLHEIVGPDVGRWGSKGTVDFSLRVFGGALVATAFLTPWGSEGWAFWSGLLFAFMIGAIFGLITAVVGVFLAPSNQFDRDVARVRRIFELESGTAPPAPTDSTHRIVGAIVVAATMERIPGCIYVTGQGLVFQSHVEGWVGSGSERRPQFRTVELRSVRTLTLGVAEVRLRGWWVRWKHQDRIPLIACVAEDGELLIRCAQMERVRRDLQGCIDHLREAASAS
jgi:hypothetical protein